MPIRYGRMLASPYAFYTGSGAVMAADLAGTPTSGFRVQLTGDARVSNFGGFDSPGGGVVFDFDEFDQTLRGPWEWDVKRLATSIHVAARIRGCEDDDSRALVLSAVSAYRRAMQEFALLPFPGVLHARLDMAEIVRRWGREVRPTAKSVGKHGTELDSPGQARSLLELATRVHGKWRISGLRSLIMPIEELYTKTEQRAVEEAVATYLWKLSQTLHGNSRRLLENFEYAHMARTVTGISSLGLRSWVVLLIGRDYEEPIFLQFKECQASDLEHSGEHGRHSSHGKRIVDGQRLLQAEPDIFLGWGRFAEMPGDSPRDYYARQMREKKLPVSIEHIPLRDLLVYGQVCAWTLARAHACTGDRIAITNYLGKGSVFDRAIADFSRLYANQNERDYHALRKAVERGVVKAQTGV
jgi:hypothetical protein